MKAPIPTLPDGHYIPLHSVKDGRCSCVKADCDSPGKHPRETGWQELATRDPKIIATWRECNLGLVTGSVSGLVVLDVDPRHDGERSLAELAREHGALPRTFTVTTGGGGWHLYFRAPDVAVKNRVGVLPGVDVRGDGGFVVAPGSRHVSGQLYRIKRDLQLAEIPAHLLALMVRPEPEPRPAGPVHPPDSPEVRAYGAAALKSELSKLSAAREGTRNDSLNTAAFNLGQLIAGGVLDRAEVERELHAVALRIGLPDDEARKTIQSGIDGGLEKPRGVPEKPPERKARAAKVEPEQQGGALTFPPVESWPEPVDGAPLFDDLTSVVRRFVVIPDAAAHAVALWVAMTWVLDHVPAAVRLIVTSPTRECGKTRLLTLLGALVRRPLLASSITPAALFRVIEAAAPTLLLDEMDNARLRENDEQRALLNSGHSRGTASVLRTVGDQHQPRRFSTWCAIAFAAIGNLPDTVASRGIAVRLQRKTRGAAVDRLREGRVYAELAPLRRRLARWALDHGSALADADPDLPDALDGRAADNAAVLVSIADAAGGAWPKRARDAMLKLAGEPVADETPGVLLLADLRNLFTDRDRLTSEEVVAALVEMEGRPWPEWSRGRPITKRGVAGLLHPFGVASRNLKLSDAKVMKGYIRADLDDVFSRYLPNFAFPSATPLPAAPAADGTAISPYATDPLVADAKKRVAPNIDAPGSAVAFEKPKYGGKGDKADVSAALLDARGWDVGTATATPGVRQ